MPTPPDIADDEDAICPPKSLADLFISCTLLALQGFGGVMAIAQREMVENKRWLTRKSFLEEWAVAQVLPGANIVNICLIVGIRFFGVPGAAAAVAGILTVPLLIILMVGALYGGFADNMYLQRALHGMAAVAAGLILATGIKLVGALRLNPMGRWVCYLLGTITFIAITVFKAPLYWVLLIIGGIGGFLAYRSIATLKKEGMK